MKIYLDWNIFTSTKNPSKKKFIDVKECIERLKDSTCFPYTSAHLSDLSKGFKKNEEPYVGFTNSDLENISKICNDES